MPKFELSSFSPLAVLLSLIASMNCVELAFAQRHYSLPSAPTYTHVTRNVVPSPRQPVLGLPPLHRTAATRQTFTASSQPVVTSVHVGPAYYASPQVPLSSASYPAAANPWVGAPTSVWPPSGQSMSCYGTMYPECTDSYDAGHCDWFCKTQKKLRSLYRASHRRSECKFEYPVLFPTGCPYGYAEPTWSQFCADPVPQVIGPAN